jgi:SAM-dependent methyltransferase/uncharacterized protein YbaR (Trm112 family)
MRVNDLSGFLVCPLDRTPLDIDVKAATCTVCRTAYPVIRDRIIDLLPPEPMQLPMPANSEFRIGYEAQFRQRIDRDSEARPWGAPEDTPPAWVAKRRNQVASVLSVLLRHTVTSELTLCDVSAGAGYYSLEYARYFRRVIHSDISPESVVYGHAKAKSLGLDNVFFCRTDYFRPPFNRNIDVAICMDSMIRGPWHEAKLLRNITYSLSTNGIAIVDLHNWWHNPVRRLGLGRQNFRECYSYTKSSASKLIQDVGMEVADYFPFRQEESASIGGLSRGLSSLIPPTRLVYLLRRAKGGDSFEVAHSLANGS